MSNNLKNILLTLITENQTQMRKAELFAELIQSELGEDWEIKNIDKYHKFGNSYKIEFKYVFNGKQRNEINNLAISLTDKLVSPWLVYFDKDENSIELIYNKDENTRKGKEEFNVIKWGHLQIVK